MSLDEKALLQLTEAELAAQIEYHNRKYWAEGDPEISDDDYDLLVRALTEKNPHHPLLVKVNAPLVSGTGEVIHKTPMLSLDKAYSIEEVLNWAQKFARTPNEKLLVQPKYDGISAIWSEGILATRGDGEKGENITDKIPLIELEHPDGTLPLGDFHGTARGEIVIRDDDFKTLYQTIRNKNGRTYKNSRNAVAGIMGLKDIRDMQLQHAKLTLADYRLHSWHTTVKDLRQDWQLLVEQVESLPYPMDGIVIKLADTAYSESLGNTAHHPRGQIAFKFSGVRRETKLINVEWSFGKNCLTPVAEVEPIDINGITIRHASLHNLQNVLDKDLHIGDTVVVERAGDVIPYIVSATPGENRVPCVIDKCPGCGAPLVQDPPELRCTNPDCFETKLKILTAAVKNIGIERLGEPNIRKMMLSLGVRSLNDIFRLTKAQILSLDGFQNLSADNLLREIATAKNVPDWQIVAALNIPGIGPNMAKVLMRSHPFAELRELTIEELSHIDGIGPERASALYRELREQKDFLNELLSCVNMTETHGLADNAKPTVCFTGKMPEKRSYYENLATQHGYTPVDSVNASLALLVCVDLNDNSSKLQKARKNNIKIMQLHDWLNSLTATYETAENTAEAKETSSDATQGGEQTESALSAPEKQPDEIKDMKQPDLFDADAPKEQTLFDF